MSKRNRMGPPGANWWDKKKPVKKPKKTGLYIKCSPGIKSNMECVVGDPLVFSTIEDLNDYANEHFAALIKVSDTTGFSIGGTISIDGIVMKIIGITENSLTVRPPQ